VLALVYLVGVTLSPGSLRGAVQLRGRLLPLTSTGPKVGKVKGMEGQPSHTLILLQPHTGL